jgi:hypothetical protein
MILRTVSVQLSRKVSDLNFGSQQVGVSLTGELQPGDDFNECFDELWQLARIKLENKLRLIVDMGESHKGT